MGIKVHRCRFLDYDRSNVTAMAFSHPSPGQNALANANLRLAAGRSNGNIEIWNPLQNWSLDITLLGSKGRSIESLAWSADHTRLFSVGASSAITEWDLQLQEPSAHFDAYAGVIWAIETSPDGKRLAAACESGVVVIFDISGGKNQVEFVKRLQSADTPLTCLTWLDNHRIVAGAADARIRAWEVGSSRIIASMKIDKTKGPEKTIVWKVLNLGGQFVSGDSNGFLKFWDSKTLSLHQSFQAHPGDVLCLATDAEHKSLFSSGLDQKIVWLRMTDLKLKRWTMMSSKVAHLHDIRCMTSYDSKNESLLVSGGLEQTVVINSIQNFDQKSSRKLPTTNLRVSTRTIGDYIYEWVDLRVRIWALNGSTEQKKLIAEIVVPGEEYISSCVLCLPRETLIVSTRHETYAFDLTGINSGKVVSLCRSTLPEILSTQGALSLDFSADRLIFVNFEHELYVYTIDEEDIQRCDKFGPELSRGPSWINQVSFTAVSPDGKTLAVAKHNNYVELFNLTSSRHMATLPRVGEHITAIAFRNAERLVIGTVHFNLYEFDLKSLELTEWSRLHSRKLPYVLERQVNNCCGIFADPKDADKVWIWGPTWLAYFDMSWTKPFRKSLKRKSQDTEEPEEVEDNDAEVSELNKQPPFFLTNEYKPIYYATSFEDGILISEKSHQQLDTKPFWSNRHIKF